jgi:hypothetical protein
MEREVRDIGEEWEIFTLNNSQTISHIKRMEQRLIRAMTRKYRPKGRQLQYKERDGVCTF